MFTEDLMDMVEAVVDNKLSHLYTEFEYAMMEHEENLLEIESKLVCENGTEDDMLELYAFESEDAKNKGHGILSRIWQTIRDFFRKIKSFFIKDREKLDETKLPDEIKLDENPEVVAKETRGLLGHVKSFLAGNKKALGNVAKAGAAAGGVAAGFILFKKKIQPTAEMFIKLADDVEKEMAATQEKLDDASTTVEEQKELKGVLGMLHKAGERINKIRKGIFISNNENYKTSKKYDDIAAKETDDGAKATYQNKSDEHKEKLHEDIKNHDQARTKDKSMSKEEKKVAKREAIADGHAANRKTIENELQVDQQQLNGIIEELRDATHELENLERRSKNIFGRDKRWSKELQALEKMPSKRMTEQQRQRYTELKDKYGDASGGNSMEIAEVKKRINKLVAQRDALKSRINKHYKAIDKAKLNEFSARRGK